MIELDPEPAAAEDPRVAALLQEYLAELELGRRPDREAYALRHPDLASTVREALDSLEFVHSAAKPRGRSDSGTVPALLGDFRILREVGRGGMGVVYEAEQISLGRRVALKVLPFAAALDGRQLQRFKNEAQAAAHLHHSNIVPVFAVGCDRGVHYYAMQFIDGQTVADLIRELRSESDFSADGVNLTESFHPGQPAPKTSTTQARGELSTRATPKGRDFKALARIAVQAADALEYAHSMGVIHRDIKPANLLIDARRHVWVADFGLALVQGAKDLTVSGDVLGTLRYMSPEQAAGRRSVVDHHADIYSLGVTLYELFTLQDPYPARDREELLRRIMHEEPRAPRKVCRDLPIELETILLKTMSKSPAERYATAQDLSDDLRRFIDDRPVLARRPTMAQVAGKWARRHRGLVRSAVLLVCLGCIALSVVAWLLNASRRELAKARDQAFEAWQETRHALDSLYEEIAERAKTGDPRRQAEHRAFLEKALVFYEKFAAEYGDEPRLRFERARAYTTTGDIQQNLNNLREAALAYRRASELLEPLIAAEPLRADYRQAMALCCRGQGMYMARSGHLDDAEKEFRRAVDLQHTILACSVNDRSNARFELSKYASNLGAMLLEQRKFDAARQSLEEALAEIEKVIANNPKPTVGQRRHLGRVHYNLGIIFQRTEQPELARKHWEAHREVSADLARSNPFDADSLEDWSSSAITMAVLNLDADRFADAETQFREAQDGYSKLLRQFPNSPQYRLFFARSTHGLARAQKEQGKLDDAKQVLEKAEKLLVELSGDYPEMFDYRIELMRIRIDHANLLADAGDLPQAERIGQQAWRDTAEGARKLPAQPDVRHHWMKLRNNLADYAWRAGQRDPKRLDEAVQGFREAIAIGERLVADHPKGANEYRDNLNGVRANLARLLQQLQRFPEAESLARTSLSEYDRLAAEEPKKARWLINRMWTLARLAQVCPERNNPDAVRSVWAEADAIADRLGRDFDGEGNEEVIALTAASWYLANCPNSHWRKADKALEFAKRAAERAPETAEVQRALGLALLRADEADDAVEALLRARRLYRQRDRASDLILALAYKAAGDDDTARHEYAEACRKLDHTLEHGDDLDRLRAEADRKLGGTSGPSK